MKKILLLALLPVTAMAASIKGIGEIYQDWDLICDNTGTCRMAGYQENRDDPVSILFTREAGPNTPVEGELTIYHSVKMTVIFKWVKMLKFG